MYSSRLQIGSERIDWLLLHVITFFSLVMVFIDFIANKSPYLIFISNIVCVSVNCIIIITGSSFNCLSKFNDNFFSEIFLFNLVILTSQTDPLFFLNLLVLFIANSTKHIWVSEEVAWFDSLFTFIQQIVFWFSRSSQYGSDVIEVVVRAPRAVVWSLGIVEDFVASSSPCSLRGIG